MQKQLLICLLLLAVQSVYGQDTKQFTHNIAERKGTVVRQEGGEYRNARGESTGSYKIIYILDTLQKQLLNVSATSRDRRGEVIYLYYYDRNRLIKASSGVVQNGYTVIQSTYAYDGDDFAIKEKDLNTLSQTEEKYALLKEGQKYLAVLKKL